MMVRDEIVFVQFYNERSGPLRTLAWAHGEKIPTHRVRQIGACLHALNVANHPSRCLRACIETHTDLPPCAGCGRCCHLVVELRAGDHVPEELVVSHDGARCMDQHSDGACVALDPVTRLCTLYETRPQTCRDFNRGEALCRQILGRPLAVV